MAAAGIIGLVVIATVVYAIAVFGNRNKKDVRQEFKAPALVQEQKQTKEDYNKKMEKELREAPRKPKEAGVLLNPFENTETSQGEANLVFSNFSHDQTQDQKWRNEEPDPEPEPESEPRVFVASVSKKQAPKRETARRTVQPEVVPDTETILPSTPQVRSKTRYGSETQGTESQSKSSSEATYTASVFGEQKIFNGSLLKIRLLSPITLPSGIVIPRNTFVSGTVTFAAERVKIKISTIPYQSVLHKVNFTVYDANDGLDGIYIQGGAIQDMNEQAGSEIAEEVLTYPGVNSVGIVKGVGNEVKKWTRKKTVTILDGHHLFLK